MPVKNIEAYQEPLIKKYRQTFIFLKIGTAFGIVKLS
jgi:hypothetical protein